MNTEDLRQTDEGCRQLLRDCDAKFACRKCQHTKAYQVTKRPFKCAACGKRQRKPDKDGSFQCHHCQHTVAKELTPIILLECAKCKKQSSATAGTLFHGAKIPLPTIFSIMKDMADAVIKSAEQVARELGIAKTTAYTYQQKIRRVLTKAFDYGEMEEVHPSYFEREYFRRSSESPACYDGETVREHARRTGQNQSAIVLAKGSMAPDAKEDLASEFQGVSRKHGQGYFDQLSYNKLYPGQLEPLIAACARSRPITAKQLATYSSPFLVKLPLLNPQKRQDLYVCEAAMPTHWGFTSSGAVHQVCVQRARLA